MIEILGPTASPFVVKIGAAADYRRLSYTHREDVSIRELSKLHPMTGKIPVVVFYGDAVFKRAQRVDWRERVEEATRHGGGSRCATPRSTITIQSKRSSPMSSWFAAASR